MKIIIKVIKIIIRVEFKILMIQFWSCFGLILLVLQIINISPRLERISSCITASQLQRTYVGLVKIIFLWYTIYRLPIFRFTALIITILSAAYISSF
jgi:hypothetical protein